VTVKVEVTAATYLKIKFGGLYWVISTLSFRVLELPATVALAHGNPISFDMFAYI